MKSISALEHIYKKGLFGDYEGKNEDDIIKVLERKNLLIVQIVQYKNSNISLNEIKIDELILNNDKLKVIFNDDTRILWTGPKSWLLVSTKKDLLKDIQIAFDQTNFAITDLSHSRAIIELEGIGVKEVLKKGCPFDFNQLKIGNCANSVFSGISITIDFIDEKNEKVRILSLRSFGESLFHHIVDSSLESGYRTI